MILLLPQPARSRPQPRSQAQRPGTRRGEAASTSANDVIMLRYNSTLNHDLVRRVDSLLDTGENQLLRSKKPTQQIHFRLRSNIFVWVLAYKRDKCNQNGCLYSWCFFVWVHSIQTLQYFRSLKTTIRCRVRLYTNLRSCLLSSVQQVQCKGRAKVHAYWISL